MKKSKKKSGFHTRLTKIFVTTTVVVLALGVGSAIVVGGASTFLNTRVDTSEQSPTKDQLVSSPQPPVLSAEELLTETNKHRKTPLTLDSVLNETAQARCQDIVQTGDYSHNNWEVHFPPSRSIRGENLAHGYGTPVKVLDAWASSPTHNKNLIDARFGKVGFGICTYEGAPLIVQHFSN